MVFISNYLIVSLFFFLPPLVLMLMIILRIRHLSWDFGILMATYPPPLALGLEQLKASPGQFHYCVPEQGFCPVVI